MTTIGTQSNDEYNYILENPGRYGLAGHRYNDPKFLEEYGFYKKIDPRMLTTTEDYNIEQALREIKINKLLDNEH